MPATAARLGRATATATLTLLLAAAAGAAVAATLTGVRVVVVASGSMEPALRTGDALIVRPTGSAGVAPTDIVVYRNGNGHRWVIHRVVEIRVVNGQRYLVTKGDANNTTDPDLTPVDAVYGQATLRVPFLGRAIHFLTTPTARLLLAVAIALVVVHELLVIVDIRQRMRARARTAGKS